MRPTSSLGRRGQLVKLDQRSRASLSRASDCRTGRARTVVRTALPTGPRGGAVSQCARRMPRGAYSPTRLELRAAGGLRGAASGERRIVACPQRQSAPVREIEREPERAVRRRGGRRRRFDRQFANTAPAPDA